MDTSACDGGANIPSMAQTRPNSERIFYDGHCGVCHWAVRFVARHDPAGRTFRFAPLEGEVFSRVLPEAARRRLPDSLVVQTKDGQLLLRSQGLVHILRQLGGVWRLLGELLALVPRPLRDFGYDTFARIRHRLAAPPADVCPLVPPEVRRRFDL
jgi:predicted DCC family thiol-disulfide oxidoreductase YuxK